jgi:hypothetical protein
LFTGLQNLFGMSTETDLATGMGGGSEDSLDSRRSGTERRASSERRRNAKGLFEHRARRDGVTDRRQKERRERQNSRLWRLFWRRAAR